VVDDKFDEAAFSNYEQEKWSGILHEDAMKICEERDLYCYWGPGWIRCGKEHPKASHDINEGVKILMNS
jgi:hypothetical protein